MAIYIRPYVLISNRPGGGFGGPGSGFGGPGGGFNTGRSSGKPLLLLRLKKTPPGLQKPVPGPPGPPLYSLLAPPVHIYIYVYKTCFFDFLTQPADFRPQDLVLGPVFCGEFVFLSKIAKSIN